MEALAQRLMEQLAFLLIAWVGIMAILEVLKEAYKSVRNKDLEKRAVKVLNLFLACTFVYKAKWGMLANIFGIEVDPQTVLQIAEAAGLAAMEKAQAAQLEAQEVLRVVIAATAKAAEQAKAAGSLGWFDYLASSCMLYLGAARVYKIYASGKAKLERQIAGVKE